MPHKKSRGFTLIELLIVLFIMGLIVAIVMVAISKSKNNGDDLKVRDTLSNLQVKLSEKEVAAGTVNYQTEFTTVGVQAQLDALAAQLGVVAGAYTAVSDANSFALVFPLKKGGYYCVDYKQAKEIPSPLNSTGQISCDNYPGGSGTGLPSGGGGVPVNNTPIANAGVDQTITAPASTVTLAGTGTDTDGTVVSYAWAIVSGVGGNISNPNSATTGVTGLTPGSYTFRLSVTDNGGATGWDTVVVTVSAAAGGSPYNGPHNIPGTIQAEDFDTGGEGIAYHDNDAANQAGKYRPTEGVDIETTADTTGAYDVGWITTGEWAKYTVVVSATGTYTLTARIASPNARSFTVELDGTAVATVSVPATGGWQTWQTTTGVSIPMTQGTHVLRLVHPSGGYNLNFLTFTGATTNQPPIANAGADQTITLPTNSTTLSGLGTDPDGSIASYLWSKISGGTVTISSPGTATTNISGLSQGTYTFRLTVTDNKGATGVDDVVISVNAQSPGKAIPGTIQAEDYDNGGEGVAFHDLTSWNSGGAVYRNDAVDIEATNDTSGTYDVSYIADGEWLKYTVNVASTGNYTITTRAASATGDGYLRMKMDGTFFTAVVIPNTGGWQTWQNIVVSGVPLTAGTHTMEVDMQVGTSWGGMNLNYYTFTYEGAATTPNPAARTLTLKGPMAAYGSPMYFYESLPKGYYDIPSKTYPLLVFLHGAGEAPPAAPTSLLTGAGVVSQINNGAQLEYTINGKTETFVVLAPQSDWWWNVNNIDKIIEFGKLNYKIDATRVYLTGLSAGSGGTAKYFAYSPTYGDAYPRKIAAAALVDGMPNTPPTQETSKDGSSNVPLNYCYASSTSLPLWIFESTGHYPGWVESLIATLNACSPAVNLKTTYTDDANSFTKAYATDHSQLNPNLYEWLLQQHR